MASLDDIVRLMIRAFDGDRVVFAKPVTVSEANLSELLPQLAEEHSSAMVKGEYGMIEIEFLDEPDPMERFFRIGVDPKGMVAPVAIDPMLWPKKR
jgi:hypothetical protein